MPHTLEQKRVAARRRYMADPEKYKSRVRAFRVRLLHQNRNYVLRQVGGRCETCGYSARPDILQFDHTVPLRDVSARRFTWYLGSRAIDNPALWDEFRKVKVLCPNCHEIKTKDNGERRSV